MFYISPFICLFYFLSIEHQIHIEYYIMFYYFAGNLLFSFTAWMLFGLFFERPVTALLNFKDELELSTKSQFNIMRFVQKVFGNQLGMMTQQKNRQEAASAQNFTKSDSRDFK